MERDEYYTAWLRTFDEAREIALALSHRHYHVRQPAQGFPTVEQVREVSSPEQWRRLMDHALAFACLDGNAFPDLIEQYIPEAWVNILWNGWASGEEFPVIDGYSQTSDRAEAR